MTAGRTALAAQDAAPLRYRACGLAIESDLALPGLLPLSDGGDADVTIAAEDLPEMLPGEVVQQGPNWARTADAFLLRVIDVGSFCIRDAAAIRYMPAPGVEREELTAFLTGSVLGILLHLRGKVVLHASAIIVGGRAMLFFGQSGAGKSTIAAALGERGYPMLSDDLGVLTTQADGTVLVEADGRRHKLWEQAIRGLSLADRQGEGVRHQINKFYQAPRVEISTATPIGGIYELAEQRAGQAFEIEPLALSDAAVVIRHNAFRARMMWQLGQKIDYFRTAALIARQARIATLRRPLDFRRIDEGLDMLEADWAGLRGGAQ